MGEYFRDRGEDALIIHDDLSNRLLLTVRSPCCSVVRQDVKHSRATFSPPLSSAGALHVLTPNTLKPSPKVK
ncbi:hypothetical protein ACVXG8_07525 [Escherichia coli]